jgi:hypothetical protein
MQAKSWRVLVLVGVLVGAGAVGAEAVSAGDPADAPGAVAGSTPAKTVEVVAKRSLMSAAAAPSVGSGFVSGGELYDAQGNAKVGAGYSHCGVVSVSAAVPPAVTTHCTSVFRLQDGELHLSGLRTYPSLTVGFKDTTMAVVGGTGAYQNARGEGTVVRTSTRAVVSYRFTFNLVDG